MKLLFKTLILSFPGLLFFIPVSIAQSSATASAQVSATIQNSIVLSKEENLSYTDIRSSSLPGTLSLNAQGLTFKTGRSLKRTLRKNANAITASFYLIGEPEYTVAVSLPTVPAVVSNGTDIMTVDNFNTVASSDAVATTFIQVGGTLHIKASQRPGSYTSVSPFPVTLHYN